MMIALSSSDKNTRQDLAWKIQLCSIQLGLVPFKMSLILHQGNLDYIHLDKSLGLVCWVLWHINPSRLFNAKSILCK